MDSGYGTGAGGGGGRAGGPRGAPGGPDRPPMQRQDTASLLIGTLNNWYKSNSQTTPYKKKFNKLRKAQEDEKSLCTSDWSGDQSMDQASYGSIFLQIKEANADSESTCDFLNRTMDILDGSLLMTIILGLLVAFPVVMITFGVKYLHECPREPKVPIYLLVGGCFGLLKLLSRLWRQVRSRHYERFDDVEQFEDGAEGFTSKSSQFSETLLSLFLIIWFFLGNYWVFRIWQPNYHQLLHEPDNWCDETVYMFSVVQLCICYGLIGVVMLFFAIVICCHQCSDSDDAA